jgi:hypothetical protein
VAVAFGGGGGEVGVVRTPVDVFVERKPKEDTDVGGVAEEELEGCAIVEGWGGDAVADKTDILEGKEPTFVGSTGAVQEAVDVVFEGLVATFGRILVLVVWFGLPCADEVCTEDILDGFAELDLCTVSDEAEWGSTVTEDVEEFVFELFLGTHWEDVRDKGIGPDEELCHGASVVNGRCIGEDGVGGDTFRSTWYIKDRVGRSKCLT